MICEVRKNDNKVFRYFCYAAGNNYDPGQATGGGGETVKMKNTLFSLFLGVLILGMSIAPVANSLQSLGNIKTSKVIEDLELDNSVYVQPDKKLTQEHLVYLEKALPYIKDSKIKQAIQDIIAEIMDDGDATSDEIQVIIESNNVNACEVYILAKVKTTDKTDGILTCFPGLYRSLFGFFAKGIYVNYSWWNYDNIHGWHLTINGNLVSEGTGYIFGYFGYVYYFAMSDPHCPEFYFKLNGFGVLIFHYGESGDSNTQQSSTGSTTLSGKTTSR